MINRYKSLCSFACLFMNLIFHQDIALISVQIQESKVQDCNFVNLIFVKEVRWEVFNWTLILTKDLKGSKFQTNWLFLSHSLGYSILIRLLSAVFLLVCRKICFRIWGILFIWINLVIIDIQIDMFNQWRHDIKVLISGHLEASERNIFECMMNYFYKRCLRNSTKMFWV